MNFIKWMMCSSIYVEESLTQELVVYEKQHIFAWKVHFALQCWELSDFKNNLQLLFFKKKLEIKEPPVPVFLKSLQ